MGVLLALAIGGGIAAAVLTGGSDRAPAASDEARPATPELADDVDEPRAREPSPAEIALVDATAAAAGCTPVRAHLEFGANHVMEGTVLYGTNPPTSGAHRSLWYDTGVYDTSLETEQQVHNLEHGHVIVQHRDLGDEAVDGFAEIAVRADNIGWVLVAQKLDMEHALALTAWGRIVTCAGAPEPAQALTLTGAFVDAFRDRSPRESIAGTPKL